MNTSHLFRKRPIPVTARQLNADSYRQILDALTPEQFAAGGENTNGTVFLELRTLEGVMHASEGDWIVQDNHRHVWPVRGSIFAETYEPITAQPPTDRAAVRDRIAEALYAHNHPGWTTGYPDLDQDERDTYLARADAVLAVLPESTGRAAEVEHLRDRLASCRQRVGIAADKATAAESILERARQARRRLTSALIAVEPLLVKPYPDDPRWTPWTRFVGPALKELTDALKTGPQAAEAQPTTKPKDGARTADLLAESATEYRVPVPEGGGTDLLVRRQALVHGAGWAVSTSARGGGRAWTAEGWQDSISALSVDRLFCWPDAGTAVTEARRALAAGVRQGGAQPQ
ncbi:hypothetical protein [Streptomyces scabiei]|uniref:Uncharacterized protein n=1 Tax=Streptomyces scabiei TaxID=1930 RepID=A0A100JR02_STRSC|nr:hypothetical protein [Streptomyces scabiei]GAQ64090.1 hypothetical protein SsS58_04480 [Streptomyces scabiei]